MNKLQDQAFEKIEWCIQQYRQSTGASFMKFVQVSFNVKGHTAGLANGEECKVKFNGQLLEKYGKRFIEDTVVHEMAHIFAHDQNPRCVAHGADWYGMMTMLGHKSPSRCHDMQTKPANEGRQYKYNCQCGREHNLSMTKHQRAQNGRSYYCVSCKQLIWRD